MSGDDRPKLGKIQLARKLMARGEAAPPSSAARATDPTPAKAPQSGVVPTVDLEQVVIAREHLELVPRPAAEALVLLPLLVRDDIVVVAMANPDDRRAIDEVEFATGKAVSPRAAGRELLLAAIAAAYDAAERGDLHYRAPQAPASSPGRARGGK